jgi:hypothetical protein
MPSSWPVSALHTNGDWPEMLWTKSGWSAYVELLVM